MRGTPPCVASLAPASFTVPAAGGWGAITVTAPAGCAWSVWVDAPWVSLLTSASGTGNGTVGYYASPNTTAPNARGAGRAATVLVGGRVVSVVQPPLPNPCWASVSTGDTSFPADGGWRAFAVSTPLPVCTWTVTTDADWITIVDRAGVGAAAPRYGVGPNPTTEARAESITVNGYPFNVSQFAGPSTGGGDGGSCVGGVFPSAASWAGDGGQGSITVSALAGCTWTASSDASWVTPMAGTGAGGVLLGYTVQPNPSETARTATLTIGTATFVVTQDVAGTTGGDGGSSCVTSVASSQTSFDASGGTGTATVSAANGCAWSAVSQATWIAVSSGGAGSGTVSYTVAPNAGTSSRLGQIVVGNQTVTIGEQAANGNTSCPQPNGNDTDDDTAAIQCLLDQGGTVTLDADVLHGYIISNPGLTLRRSGTTLTSTSAWSYRALLIAAPTLTHPILQVESGAVSGYTIENIWFDGNRFNRPCDHTQDIHENVNVRLRGGPFTVDNVESDQAVCGSGMIVDDTTHDFWIANSWFAFNGFSLGTPGHASDEWSDGLTVHACVNGSIHDNHFLDNTDVDLIFGGTGHCTVTGNVINHYSTYGFAGLMLGWFDEHNAYPDYSQFTFSGNHVTSQADELSVGLMIGFHPWGKQYINNQLQLPWISNVGQVGSALTPNTMTGAVINLAIDGIQGGVVSGNELGQSQGNPNQNHSGLNDCPTVANYTAGHFEPAQIQNPSLAVPLVWDQNGELVLCRPPQQ